jgi:NTP pyrophosphatase (non-canonical NTP hydrolase)
MTEVCFYCDHTEDDCTCKVFMPTGEKTLRRWGDEILEWRLEKGFYTPPVITKQEVALKATYGDMMLGKLMLVTTEIAEAAEAVRKEDWGNFKEELADTFIRLLDITSTCNIDIDHEISVKMEKNRKRAHKHGKKTSI